MNKVNKPKRFRDLAVGQFFRMYIGALITICEKISDRMIRVKKLNNPGFMEIPLNPELNEDDCYPIDTHDVPDLLSWPDHHGM